jgi:DNA-binding GntR family transcriptional regulator
MDEIRKSETLATATYQRLRQDIISGAFDFGRKLPIRAICEMYGVSLSPAREALNRASHEGLIIQTDLRGFRVAPLDEKDLDDLHFVRCTLNEVALRKSIERGDAAWEESVLIAYHRMARMPFDRASVSTSWEAAHRVFHVSLLSACGSERLLRYCEQLFDAANRYRFLARTVSGIEPGPSGDHKLIMEAAVDRNAEEAARLLREHFTRTADRCKLVLKELAERQAGRPPAPEVEVVSST